MEEYISRQAAIDALYLCRDQKLVCLVDGKVYIDFDEAEVLLRKLPSAQTDLITRQAEIEAYITKCPYFSGKTTIDRSVYGTHIGSCALEFHYRKICPSSECHCAERLGLKNG